MNPRQRAVLEFIQQFNTSHEYTAIMTDIVRKFGFSHETARYNIRRLVTLGYVDWQLDEFRTSAGYKTRAIIVLQKE